LTFARPWICAGTVSPRLPNPDPVSGRPSHGGRDRHPALEVTDLDRLILRLGSAAIPFGASRSGRRALFCRDRDGNALESIEVRSRSRDRD